METQTRRLWAEQDRHPGDRHRLFAAVAAHVDARRVLYPGSWIDVAASFVWPAVTYVDMDRRAARFFADPAGVAELIAMHVDSSATHEFDWIPADYTSDLDLDVESFDLLLSLYAGFISDHCTQHLRVGGSLLVNPSHGDAAMASIDPRYELSGVVINRDGDYTVRTDDLDAHMVPKRPIDVTRAVLRERGQGIAYTRSAFAYLFTRVA